MGVKRLSPEQLAEAAALLRRVLALVDSGDLSADGPAAVGLVRRLEGVVLTLEALESPPGHQGK